MTPPPKKIRVTYKHTFFANTTERFLDASTKKHVPTFRDMYNMLFGKIEAEVAKTKPIRMHRDLTTIKEGVIYDYVLMEDGSFIWSTNYVLQGGYRRGGHAMMSNQADRIVYAGEMLRTNARRIIIDNSSGHYMPSKQPLYEIARYLDSQMSGITVSPGLVQWRNFFRIW